MGISTPSSGVDVSSFHVRTASVVIARLQSASYDETPWRVRELGQLISWLAISLLIAEEGALAAVSTISEQDETPGERKQW